MLYKTISAAVYGIDANLIEVEVDISGITQGEEQFCTVGLPDAAVKESRQRVRSALKNCGYDIPPTRITINLAPADLKKEGSGFDLPMALGIVGAYGGLTKPDVSEFVLVGELSLDGSVRPVRGALPIAVAARANKVKNLIVPEANANEAAMVSGINVLPVKSMMQVINHHLGTPERNTFFQTGFFTFGSAVTGYNLADFILGQGANFAQGGGLFYDYGGLEGSLFAQDNWRISQKLVINGGLRWEPYFPYTDTLNRIPCYRPGLHSQRYPNAPTGLIYAGDPGCSAGGTEGVTLNFAPRLGFAYRIGKSTVIRGGAGLYYTLPNTAQINGPGSVAPFAPIFSLSSTSFNDPYGTVGMTNPFPAAFGGKSVPGPDTTFSLPVAINGTFPTRYHLPTLGTWNLRIEQQFGSNWLLSLGYFGNRGYHLSSNAVDSRELNPAIYIPGQSTHDNTQARRIDPNFSSVSLYPTDFNSRYHSLQVNVEKRLSKGFSMLANYTWSKAQDDEGPAVNPFDVHNFGWGNSNTNLPNVFHLSAIWVLPNAPIEGLASTIINGWEITGINSWQNGFPFTVYSGVDNSFSGVGSDRADFTGSNISRANFGDRSHTQMVNQYFDTSLFTVNAVGTYGNAPRNKLANPGLFNLDMAVMKYFPINERLKFQFRAEFFNVLNNVNFTVPGLGSANPNQSAAGNIVGTGNFGKLTCATDPRILQFALKFIF